MFKDCVSLKTVDLTNFSFAFDSTNYPNPCQNMFYISSSDDGANYIVDRIYIGQSTI